MPNVRVNMRREALGTNAWPDHAGLMLDKSFLTSGEDNNAAQALHERASNVECSELYKKAFENWQQTQTDNTENSQVWYGKLVNRMYLGMGSPSPLEAGITLHHLYGVPYIPGSAIKGVLRHYLDEISEDDENTEAIKNTLFGHKDTGNTTPEDSQAGYIIFNDAWWIPEGDALSPEIITVHAPLYYSGKGKPPHPDLESPNPNPQIAIQGSFMFSLEGESEWVKYTIKLLKQVLENRGIGGKTASGYGYFIEAEKPLDEADSKAAEFLQQLVVKIKTDNNIPDDKEGDAYAGKVMAEMWQKIEDESLKQRVYQQLERKWENLNRYPSKKNLKFYAIKAG